MKNFIKYSIIFVALLIMFIVISLSPIAFMAIVRKAIEVGFKLNESYDTSIISISMKESINIGDFYYYYSQILDVVITALFTFVLVYFAFKDFYDKNIKKFELDFEISEIIELVIEPDSLFIHFPISFINLSKRLGFINDISLYIFDEKLVLRSKLKPTHFVHQNIDYSFTLDQNNRKSKVGYFEMHSKRYEDGLPFVGIPINAEQSIREYITFKQIVNKSPLEFINFNNAYYIGIKYKNKKNKKNNKFKLYRFKLARDKKTHIEVMERAKILYEINFKKSVKAKNDKTRQKYKREFDEKLKGTNRIEVDVSEVIDKSIINKAQKML